MTKRELIAHAGGNKAGSTALQLYFWHNKAHLERAGISYENETPLTDSDHLTSGNGIKLVNSAAGSPASDLRLVIETYFRGRSRALCSTEFFAKLEERDFLKLRACCVALNIEVRFVFIVRDVASFLASNYVQTIKCEGKYESIHDYISGGAVYDHAVTLRRMATVFPIEHIKVLHYETVKQRLDLAVMPLLGLDPAAFNPRWLDMIVNRNLVDFELDLARKANRIYAGIGFGSIAEHLSNSFSGSLVHSRPNLIGRHVIPDDLHPIVAERYQSDVDWINRTFFEGRQVVSVLGRREQRGDVSELSLAQKIEILEDAFLWAVTSIADSYRDGGDRIANRYLEAARDRALSCERPSEGIPSDFDPVYYLMINLDVLKAGADPYQHYLHWGRAEGRPYSWRQL